MTLLIFNNGTPSAEMPNRKRNPVIDYSLKQIDLSSPYKQFQQTELPYVEKEAPQPKKKAAIAYPNQTLSYINTGKAADSLENRRRLRASHVKTTPVITAMPHELVTRAKLLMHDNDISHLVIFNNEHHPLGLINAKDLLAIDSPETSFIHSIVDLKVLAVSEDTLVRDIALIFMKYKSSALSVVNSQHKVVGIISRSDLLSLLVSGPNQTLKA